MIRIHRDREDVQQEKFIKKKSNVGFDMRKRRRRTWLTFIINVYIAFPPLCDIYETCYFIKMCPNVSVYHFHIEKCPINTMC